MMIRICSLVLALTVVLAGAPSAQPNEYIVGPQDVLTVTVYDQADLSGKFQVDADGTFTFPLIGRVKAGGLTLHGVEAELEEGAGRRLPEEPAGHRRGRTVQEPAHLRHGRSARARHVSS